MRKMKVDAGEHLKFACSVLESMLIFLEIALKMDFVNF